jgi:hypothetical protein
MEPSQISKTDNGAVDYADGLRYHLEEGWYEFKCPLPMVTSGLAACIGKQPAACIPAICAYLVASEGGNLGAVVAEDLDDLVQAIAVLYARLLAGDGLLDVLQELESSKHGIGFKSPCADLSILKSSSRRPTLLHYKAQAIPDSSALMKAAVDLESVESVVMTEVQSAIAIDLHTHLLPPTHGSLCLWGIDELLTYVRTTTIIVKPWPGVVLDLAS